MLLPQLIDTLNRHNMHAIQQLELMAPQIHQLQELAEKMNGAITDICTIRGGFLVTMSTPHYWHQRRTELTYLLHDYDVTTPVDMGELTACGMHNYAQIWIKFAFAAAPEMQREAA